MHPILPLVFFFHIFIPSERGNIINRYVVLLLILKEPAEEG